VLLFTGRISVPVPDPALVDEPAGRPPLLVRKLLPGSGHSAANFALEQLELVVAVDADQLRAETATGARRVGVAPVAAALGVHHEQILHSAVRQPVAACRCTTQHSVHMITRRWGHCCWKWDANERDTSGMRGCSVLCRSRVSVVRGFMNCDNLLCHLVCYNVCNLYTSFVALCFYECD